MKQFRLCPAYLLFAVALVFASCSDDEPIDVVKPTLSINEVENGNRFRQGDTIKANLVFSDNVELASWKIDIKSASEDNLEKDKAWKYKGKSGAISGRNGEVNVSVKVADDATPGKYQFVVTVFDKAGNSDRGFVDIELIDKNGRDKDGFDKAGYNERGFDRNGKHKNGTDFDERGFNVNGYHKDTGGLRDPEGFDMNGYNKDGV